MRPLLLFLLLGALVLNIKLLLLLLLLLFLHWELLNGLAGWLTG